LFHVEQKEGVEDTGGWQDSGKRIAFLGVKIEQTPVKRFLCHGSILVAESGQVIVLIGQTDIKAFNNNRTIARAPASHETEEETVPADGGASIY